jgi:hypothetical protein
MDPYGAAGVPLTDEDVMALALRIQDRHESGAWADDTPYCAACGAYEYPCAPRRLAEWVESMLKSGPTNATIDRDHSVPLD